MDGILLLEDLTTNVDLSRGSHPPKTIFISFTDLEPREAYGLGVEAILQKPIDRVRLVDTVRRALRSRQEAWSEIPESRCTASSCGPAVCFSRYGTRLIAFGRGGFCLYLSSPMWKGPVRFDLEFEDWDISLARQGLIRWAEPDECLLGVEILNLASPAGNG